MVTSRPGHGDAIPATDENGEKVSELFAVATTLLDVEAYPAIDLAQLYHARCRPRRASGI